MYIYFSLIQEATVHHPQILYRCPEFCWSFWSPWFHQLMTMGFAGFFLQCLDILSWLTLGDNVEPRDAAGERKGIDVTPCALAYAKFQVKIPCCLLLLPHSCGCTTESITLEEAFLWEFREFILSNSTAWHTLALTEQASNCRAFFRL